VCVENQHHGSYKVSLRADNLYWTPHGSDISTRKTLSSLTAISTPGASTSLVVTFFKVKIATAKLLFQAEAKALDMELDFDPSQ